MVPHGAMRKDLQDRRSPPANRDATMEPIAAWIDDIAGHAEAAEAIAKLGEAAIPGLRDYLGRGPQVIPQPRCFAVSMLARLHEEASTNALREVLRDNVLHGLTPQLAESEYVVKSAAMEALAARSYPALADDVAFGVGERLRAAVTAAGRLRQSGLAEALTGLLDDDVLADTAAEALIVLGAPASVAIRARLDAWLMEAGLSARRRLALLRALRVMYAVHGAVPVATLEHALRAEHPAVRAAASLLAWPRRRDMTLADNLLHGALCFDRDLADDCRQVLRGCGPQTLGAANAALQRNAEPDLYGTLRPLTSEQHDWLVRFMRAKGEA
jgi:hypothetical protein